MVQLIQVIREGNDLNTIRQLFREYEAELNVDLCFQSFDAELKDPLKKYGLPVGALLLAVWEGEAAGCIALTPLKEVGVCEMKRLFVRPAYRKYGIGRFLVEALLEEATQRNYTLMKLDTLQRLQPAIRLYEQYGFVHTGAYYDNPIGDVAYMEKKLD
ncbi:MAG TPA: GNAT family N-acetyltransferase [Chitinophagaceae bacterium]|jgi:GNAT superfamily N-acetyltransferase